MATEVLIRERKSVKHGKTYEYRFETASIGGKRQWISKSGFLTAKEAKTAGIAALNEYNNCGNVVFDSNISFADFLDIWLEEECKTTLKSITIASYQKKIKNHIIPALGKYALKNIKRTDLQNFLNKMHDNGYSKNSIVEIKGILTKCLSYAVEEKYLSVSPAVGVKKPKSEFTKIPTRSAPHSYLTQEKMDLIFKRFPQRSTSYIPLLIGYRCGLRIGETFGLLWEDIDFSAKTLSVKRQIQWKQNERPEEIKKCENGKKSDNCGYLYFSNPKYNSFRTIDLDDELLDILRQEKEQQEAAKAYFRERYTQCFADEHKRINTTGNGKPINLICVRENGTYITPRTLQHTSAVIHNQLLIPEFDYHSLRHTHTTMLIESGAPIKYVQARLGHKNIDVTFNIYQHLTENQKAQGNAILNHMFAQ